MGNEHGKDQKKMDPNAVVILAGGSPSRGHKLKCNERIGRNTILERQIDIFKSKFPTVDIFIYLSNAEEFKESPRRDVFVTGCLNTRSLTLAGALEDLSGYNKVLFSHGDLIFTGKSIQNFPSDFVLAAGRKQRSELGLMICNGKCISINYGLKPRWGQIWGLSGDNLSEMQKICSKYPNHTIGENLSLFCEKRPLEVITSSHFYMDIDTPNDLKIAREHFKQKNPRGQNENS